MLTADQFRRLALGLHGALESSHMGHPDFRANGRIFATLHPGDRAGMVKLSPEEQAALLQEHPSMFKPSAGAWGRQGCTDVRLEAADEAAVRAALVLAWEGVGARPTPAQRRRAPKGATKRQR